MFASSPEPICDAKCDDYKGEKAQCVIQRSAKVMMGKENECLFSLRQADEWGTI